MTAPRRLEAARAGSGRFERFLARPWRLALLVFLVVGIPTTAVSIGQIRETRAELRSQVLAQADRTSASIATIIDGRLSALQEALTAATGDPDLRDAVAARDGVRLAGLLIRARGVIGPDVASLMAFDRGGQYLSGSPFQPELIGQAPSGSDHALRSLTTGPSISGVETVGAERVPTVAIAAPIHDRSGEPAGAVSATVDLARMAGWVTPFLPSIDDVYLIDARGRLVLRASDPRDRALRELGTDPLVRIVLAGGTLTEDARDPLTGRQAVLATRPLEVTGWHILTSVTPERVERQIGRLAASFLTTTVLLVSLLLVAAVLLAHTSARVLDALRQQALTDPLTGLYNRRFMDEQLAVFDSLAQRHGRPYSVIAFDLDGLKGVNDAFGHDAGDDLIRDFGLLLRERLRESDVAIRTGGDEFVAILPETSMPEATEVFERIREAIKEWAGDPRRAVTVSAGAVTWHAGRAPEELVQVADEMLYRAKRAGRDQVVAEPPAA